MSDGQGPGRLHARLARGLEERDRLSEQLIEAAHAGTKEQTRDDPYEVEDTTRPGWRVRWDRFCRYPSEAVRYVGVALMLITALACGYARYSLQQASQAAPVAQILARHSVTATADKVDVRVCGGMKNLHLCEVAADVGGTRYHLKGIDPQGYWADLTPGWHSSQDSDYAAPLVIRFVPGDPQTAMSATDFASAPSQADVDAARTRLWWCVGAGGFAVLVTFVGLLLTLLRPTPSLEAEWDYVRATGQVPPKLP